MRRHYAIFCFLFVALMLGCDESATDIRIAPTDPSQTSTWPDPPPTAFPSSEMTSNAMQLRLSHEGMETLGLDMEQTLAQMWGRKQGSLLLPPMCNQLTSKGAVHVCGRWDGTSCKPVDPPCTVHLDVQDVQVAPHSQRSDALAATVRFKFITTGRSMPITGAMNCQITVNSTYKGAPDMVFRTTIRFDKSGGRTRLRTEGSNLASFDKDDLGLCCDGSCYGDSIKDMVVDGMEDNIDQLSSTLLCAQCTGGRKCPAGATCDSRSGLCMRGRQCADGVEARYSLPNFPAESEPLDVFGSLGGTVDVDSSGLTLGMVTGITPATDDPGCVVPQPDRKPTFGQSIPAAQALKAGTSPGGKPFAVGLAVHKRMLEKGLWSAYTAGTLCFNVDNTFSPLLNSGALTLLAPSVAGLTGGRSLPVRIAVRPSLPPTLTLGRNPLLRLQTTNIAFHFQVLVDARYIHVLTVTADLDLPIELRGGAKGKIEPVFGDFEQALSNVRVTGNKLITEDPKTLAPRFPPLFGMMFQALAEPLKQNMPQLTLLGHPLTDPEFFSIESNTMLGIFGQLGEPS